MGYGWLLCLVAIALVAAPGPVDEVWAQSPPRPRQLIQPPLLLDPYDLDPSNPVDLRLRVYHLVDTRRVENYTLTGWRRIGNRHAFAWQLAYAGVEEQDFIRYGGGAPRVQWTTHLAPAESGGLAIDLGVVPPVGDKTLYPVSAQAPSVEGRLRWSPIGRGGWRLWLGYWGRRVSPPDERTVPLEYFPSGSGLDLSLRGHLGPHGFSVFLQRALGGLSRAVWLDGEVQLALGGSLALVTGVSGSLGDDEERLFDVGWTVGLSWRAKVNEGGRLVGAASTRLP